MVSQDDKAVLVGVQVGETVLHDMVYKACNALAAWVISTLSIAIVGAVAINIHIGETIRGSDPHHGIVFINAVVTFTRVRSLGETFGDGNGALAVFDFVVKFSDIWRHRASVGEGEEGEKESGNESVENHIERVNMIFDQVSVFILTSMVGWDIRW